MTSPPTITVVANPTRFEIARARLQLLFRTPIMIGWLALAMLMPAMWLGLARPDEPIPPGTWAPLAFVLLLPIGFVVAGIRSRSVAELRDHGMRYTFSAENIVAESRNATTTFSWSLVRRAWETSTLFALVVHQQIALVPKRCLETGDEGGLRSLLVERGFLRR